MTTAIDSIELTRVGPGTLLKLGIRLSEDAFVVAQVDGSSLQPRSLTHAFQLFMAKHKLPRVRLHHLRHSHATALLKNKVHPKVVQERLGHSTIAITMDIYSHVLTGQRGLRSALG